jgi:hypothetical protein
MKKALLVALVFAGLAAVSCNKDDDDDNNNPPPAETAVDVITAGAWSIDTIGFDTDMNGVIDTEVPGGFEACEMDNTLTFNKDSTGVFDEAAAKCDAADPQTIPFQWYFTSNDSIINFQGDLPGELTGDVNVLTLTSSSLVMSKRITITFPAPFDQNLIIALKK